jgi:hypothetical protein
MLLNNFLFYRVGLLVPRPIPIPEDQDSVFISPRDRVATQFSRLLRHAWVTVRLFLFAGHHTGNLYIYSPSYSLCSARTHTQSEKNSIGIANYFVCVCVCVMPRVGAFRILQYEFSERLRSCSVYFMLIIFI